MKAFNSLVVFVALLATLTVGRSYAAQQPLSFAQAIKTAQQNDPWLIASQHKQQSLESLSRVAKTQPDPTVSVAFANLPTDGFDFGQEGMTQFKVAISQMFARGDSLTIKNKQLQLASQQHPLQRQDRKNKLAVTVGNLWLDLYRVQQSIALINESRSLFEQLAYVAEASYSSALGKTRQQDIVRAQLELTRLEDKLNQFQLEQNRYQGMLARWLNDLSLGIHDQIALHGNNGFEQDLFNTKQQLTVSEALPALELLKPNIVFAAQLKVQQLAVTFANHPSVKAMDKKIASTEKSVVLAEQKYQPQWGINASYGYRYDDPMGNSRADLVSVGLVFDVPLFSKNRQVNEVKSAVSQTQAIKTEKLLLLRELISAFASARGRLLRIQERQDLYKNRLLPQISDQAQASLTAYTNDDGDFGEVVRARIAQLNSQIDYLAINVKQQQITLEINYLFAGSPMKPSQENNNAK
jgi:hypothetical protein